MDIKELIRKWWFWAIIISLLALTAYVLTYPFCSGGCTEFECLTTCEPLISKMI